MARRTKKVHVINDVVEEALRAVAAATKDDPAASRAARTAATRASAAAKRVRAEQDAELRQALQAARALTPEAIDRAFGLLSDRRLPDCPGAVCAAACGAGCIVGCAVTGGLTVGFGAAGGTAGGASTAIAVD